MFKEPKKLNDQKKDYHRYDNLCEHQYAPLGFEKISTDETKVEVIACIFCNLCGMFRTKILFFDRQKDLK